MVKDLSSQFAAHERWEVFCTEVDAARVEFRGQRHVETDVRRIEGASVRLISGETLGTASSTHGDLAATVRAARRATLYGRPAIIDFPAAQTMSCVTNFDAKVAALTTGELADWLAASLAASDVAAISNASVSAHTESICRHIANHKGLDAAHRSTVFTVSISANLGDGFETLRESATSCHFDIELAPLFRRFLDAHRLCSGAATRPDTALPAVFSEKAVSSLMDVLEMTLVSVFNAPTTTLLRELRGQPLLREDVQIVDAGAADWLPGSSPFDDEGVPKRQLTIIENGTLRNSIFDLRSASLKNEKPTGNAARRFDSAPAPQFSNAELHAGSDSEEDMLASLQDGLFIEQMKNIRLIPGACAEFQAEIGAGFRVRNGLWAGPVRACEVAGNLFRILGVDLAALGKRTRRLLGSSAPCVLVKELYVCS
jgi:PmbA protein